MVLTSESTVRRLLAVTCMTAYLHQAVTLHQLCLRRAEQLCLETCLAPQEAKSNDQELVFVSRDSSREMILDSFVPAVVVAKPVDGSQVNPRLPLLWITSKNDVSIR